MKKTKVFAALFILSLFLVQACAWIEVNTESSNAVAKISSRRLGFEIAKKYPEAVPELSAACQAILVEGNETDIIKALVRHVTDVLGSYIDDPLLSADISDVLGLIKIKPGIPITEAQIKLIQTVASGLVTGMEMQFG